MGVPMTWTDERIAILEEMWCAGRSAREVAEILGVTRNAVIGKANRMGLVHNSGSSGGNGSARAERRKRPTSPAELTERMCRWPHGHPGDPDFHYCGARRVPGRPYCEEHCMIAYRGRASDAA